MTTFAPITCGRDGLVRTFAAGLSIRIDGTENGFPGRRDVCGNREDQVEVDGAKNDDHGVTMGESWRVGHIATVAGNLGRGRSRVALTK